jgi:mannan endo-1,4-beta-mannosidase
VEYLRDAAGLHNLLYAYSPDARFMQVRGGQNNAFSDLAQFQAQYFYAYPGDDYVDVLGLDNYADVEVNLLPGFQSGLEMLVRTSHDRSDLKIPALTETAERWNHPANWWTTFLYPGLTSTRRAGAQVAWVLGWRNWDDTEYAVPYPGSPAAADFVAFQDKRQIHFEDEIPFPMYTWP